MFVIPVHYVNFQTSIAWPQCVHFTALKFCNEVLGWLSDIIDIWFFLSNHGSNHKLHVIQSIENLIVRHY